MREAVGVGVVSGLQAEGSRVSVHLLNEVLDRLVGSHPPLVVLLSSLLRVAARRLRICIAAGRLLSLLVSLLLLLFIIFVPSCHLEQVLPEMLSKTGRCVVAAGKHQTVQ